MDSHRSYPAVVVDTNILMTLPTVYRLDWGVSPITVYVLDTVVDELRGLASDREDRDKAAAAQEALSILDNLQRRSPPEGVPLPNNAGHLVFARAPSKVPSPLDHTSVDHQQIALAQAHLKGSPQCFCAILTNDQEMADIAISASPAVPVIAPGRGPFIERAIQRQLESKLRWWQRFHEEAAAERPQPVKPARRPPRPRSDAEARQKRAVSRLYGRLRSARHRAIMSIAPLEVRLSLTAHLVRILTQRKNRALFLFVEDQPQAEYWAGELRRRCDLRRGAVLVFGEGGVPRPRRTQVAIYRHPQIESRFNQHAARFVQAGQRITVVADGCDLLDPVWIAMLLFVREQFVGFTRYPLGHAQAVGGRMLAAFFQQETVATYTFADAEEDGWFSPFDVLRHRVSFQDDELEVYREVNDRFITIHGQVGRRYPELSDVSRFGESLHRILERPVDQQAASLFMLREQREEIAQMARAKCETVVRLLREADSPARCLVCDLERLWTPVLLKELADQGLKTEPLDRSSSADARENAWRRFAAGKLDCLILQDVPPARWGDAHINRLIITTPLTPLSSLAATVDWVLSHAVGGHVVRVDLLYTSGTPEEQAMTEFADTCCGLRLGW